MNPAHLSLAVQTSWDASVSVHAMIEEADYALLRDNEVTLVVQSTDEVLRGVSLTVEGGLHYDGDFTIEKNLAQKKIEEGEWAVTQEWQTAEEHLK